jgi:hypothetical protein
MREKNTEIGWTSNSGQRDMQLAMFPKLCTTASAFCQPGAGVNIPEQNERIGAENVDIVWRQVTSVNLLGEVELLSFRQPGAIA